MSNVKRNFIIGDEWLYFKIYCGPKSADKILTQALKPLCEELLNQGIITKWFFIRYSDPQLHIRIRFLLSDVKEIGKVIIQFNQAIAKYVDSGLISKVQSETYSRELERYGWQLTEHAESFFFNDSNMIIQLLDMLDEEAGEEIRWLFSLCAIDQLLSDFNFDLNQKHDLLERMKTSFANEFNMEKNLKLQMDDKFRNNRKKITDFLTRQNIDEDVSPIFELLVDYSERNKSVAKAIEAENDNIIHLNDLMPSYIHMLCNRMFRAKQRLHEMVLYDFLYRFYKSEIAKQKSRKPQLELVVQ